MEATLSRRTNFMVGMAVLFLMYVMALLLLKYLIL